MWSTIAHANHVKGVKPLIKEQAELRRTRHHLGYWYW
jgi:hypothetical protein